MQEKEKLRRMPGSKDYIEVLSLRQRICLCWWSEASSYSTPNCLFTSQPSGPVTGRAHKMMKKKIMVVANSPRCHDSML